MSGRFAGERAVVVGAGVAGSSAARVLVAEGATVRVSESRPRSRAVHGGRAPRRRGRDADRRPRPLAPRRRHPRRDRPGCARARPRARVGSRAWPRRSGARWSSGLGSPSVPYVAVTGTNGKTTTTGMIEACLRADGIDAVACGNIGHPFPEAAREGHEALVVECSSFQLRLQESFHPRVSVLLNLAPDHLDEHGSFEAYADGEGAHLRAPDGRRHPRRQSRRRRRRRALGGGAVRGRVVPIAVRPTRARSATTATSLLVAPRQAAPDASGRGRRHRRAARRRRRGRGGLARVRASVAVASRARARGLRAGAAPRAGRGGRRRRAVHRRLQGHERARRARRDRRASTTPC